MRNLKNTIFSFLKTNCRDNLNYGVAYSGGGDSKALLYLLVGFLKEFKVHLHVLHVDHGWRENSTQEADFLENEVKHLNLKFYRHTLKKSDKKHNLEDRARNERILFFAKITKVLNLQGIFLAHHGDDLAETVLKRIFEGAHLENLGGMKSISYHLDTVFFRPLLQIRKTELKEFLKKYKLDAIDDLTNYDSKFLRARMRKNLFPLIEDKFGKSITNNLLKLSQRSYLFNSYIEENLKDTLVPYEKGPFGLCYDFNKISSLHFLEKEYLLKKNLKKEGQIINSVIMSQIIDHLELKSANKKFILDKICIICDRGFLFFLHSCNISAQNSVFSIKKNQKEIKSKIGWKAFWSGAIICPIPKEDIDVKLFSDLNEVDQRKISAKWEMLKIPTFLRREAPILCQNGKIIQDVLNSELMCKDQPTCFFEWKIRDYNLIS